MTDRAAAKYLGVDAAAAYLGVSVRTFYDHVRQHVQWVRIGSRVVFDPADLDAFCAARKVVPDGWVEPEPEPTLITPSPHAPAQPTRQLGGSGKLKKNQPEPPKRGVARNRLDELRRQGLVK